MAKRLWLTGYRSYELNVYQDNDPKLQVIKYSLRNTLRRYLEDGLTWVITGAQLGTEQWAVTTVGELKADYPDLRVAVMLPFTAFGQQWNEKNQSQLAQILAKADFVGYTSDHPYENPGQLQNYQQFMGQHTENALLLYDPEHPGKPHYDYDYITKVLQPRGYGLELIDFYELQDLADEMNHDY
ncbi:DUF1273 domain-containing protein [Lapidilactobacillus luobeiensis]|uniref:DUF1273 domain-containing protein n=1 Tax=Lapidilactobacillus luobeiensis TaxID=2950371 RepID=UPI0021C4374C|nr:DUF1273 domain-containing protein [Lapidilactobacillus luobeiensis]